MSYESFRKKFREHLDTSPTQYRTQKRLEHAVNLLIEGRVTIKEVAFEIGYSDVGNFSKQFHAWMGQTPGQFRKSNRSRLDRNI
jgi:AraC-like DNA-binding protein